MSGILRLALLAPVIVGSVLAGKAQVAARHSQ
jgi:hypothetical protein